MDHQDLAEASAALGAVGAPLLLFARERLVLLAGTGLLAAAEVGLAYALVPDAPSLLTESTVRVALLVLAALGALTVTAVFVRFPAAALVALLVAAPFRLSVTLGSETASLLLPLYAVLVAAGAALLYRVIRGEDVPAVPLLVGLPAAAFIGLAGISLLWARDLRAASIELVFFYFPFALLLVVVARTRLATWSGRALATGLLALTGLLAAIGIYQAWSHTLIVAKEDIRLGNAFSTYFRTTSLFEDPSVYARHLVLGMLVVLVLLSLERLRALAGIALLALLATGLYFSYSQTSFVALFVGVLSVGLVAGDVKTRRILAAAAAAVVLAGGVLITASVDGQSASRFTGDRLPLARITLPVYTDHPVAGVGIGSQPLVSRGQKEASRKKTRNASHTTPLTVAAELGTLGVLAYGAFLVGVARALLLTWRREAVLGLVLIACLTALVTHSLFYGAFFEDPLLWGLVGLAASSLAFAPQTAADLTRPPPERATRPSLSAPYSRGSPSE